MIKVDEIGSEERSEYDEVVRLSRCGWRCHTWKWLRVLERFTGAEKHLLGAKKNGVLVGVLPTFIKRNGQYGNVLNSLPFFGTHGGPIVLDSLLPYENLTAKKSLLLAFKELATTFHCVYSTLITSPFERDQGLFGNVLKSQYLDERATQIATFPLGGNAETVILHGLVEKRCRNAVNKAMREGVTVELAANLDHVDRLIELHRRGMEGVGGIVKPRRWFDVFFDEYAGQQNKAFKIYYAWKDDKIIAGLLLICYETTIDYFTPAFDRNYKEFQANTLLIYTGMKDAINEGYRSWNFGGGARLGGVYNFKKSWGAKDYPYTYYINAYGRKDKIRSLSKQELLKEYEWFYVLPFSALEHKREESVICETA